MGTRGFLGFVADGTEKIAYNHFDSYPSGLGTDVLGWLRRAVVDTGSLQADVRRLRVVDETTPPTTQDIERLKPYADTNVGRQELDDWYVLLRKTQGNPEATLAAGVMLDGSDFPADSLFAEYGYVVDTDAQVFEAYVGFVKAPHTAGRFAKPEPNKDGYYPARLVASFPFSALPSDDDFIKTVEPDEA